MQHLLRQLINQLYNYFHFQLKGNTGRRTHILAALGVLTLIATVYIAWLVPAPLLRLIVWTLANVLFKIRIVGAENIPPKTAPR